MSLPSYVLNWDELIHTLKDQINVVLEGDMNLDFSSIEDLFNQYFPDIIDLLKAIIENTKKTDGIQKMKGYHEQVLTNKAYVFTFAPEEDVMLTGITYAQSIYKCCDRFDLVVMNEKGDELKLFDGLYVKDAMQHKLFQVFFPVPRGYQIKLIMYNESSTAKDVWVDFEYLGVTGLNPTSGTIIIKYLTEGVNDWLVLYEESLNLPLGVHTIQNTKTFDGYTPVEPLSKMLTLTTNEPTRIIEFFYKKEELSIGHDYDIKVTLRWEDNSSVDVDLYGFINQNQANSVSYRQKEYFETETDKLWLDHDFTSHGESGYIDEPEILTVLGFKNATLSIQLQNYNSNELREDVLVEVSTLDGSILSTHTISKLFLNQGSTRAVHVCDINIGSNQVSENIKAIGNVGEF